MTYTLEHKKDGRTMTVTQQVYDAMSSRGDARNWTVVRRIAAVPVEAPAEKKGKKAVEIEPPPAPDFEEIIE